MLNCIDESRSAASFNSIFLKQERMNLPITSDLLNTCLKNNFYSINKNEDDDLDDDEEEEEDNADDEDVLDAIENENNISLPNTFKNMKNTNEEILEVSQKSQDNIFKNKGTTFSKAY